MEEDLLLHTYTADWRLMCASMYVCVRVCVCVYVCVQYRRIKKEGAIIKRQ
jgi:hypothetical protein